jgi:hypothetical protein
LEGARSGRKGSSIADTPDSTHPLPIRRAAGAIQALKSRSMGIHLADSIEERPRRARTVAERQPNEI